MTTKVRGIRGATCTDSNDAEAIYAATRELMLAIVEANHIEADDVASVILTMSPDLTAAFPAKAVRSLENWQWVPLMCASELNVPDSVPKCIRILIHLNTELSQQDLIHVYLRDAIVLRPDLVQS